LADPASHGTPDTHVRNILLNEYEANIKKEKEKNHLVVFV
jgi:hypothetical protein